MTSYILDVNILFSSLLSGKGLYRNLFGNFSFYTPDFALQEINNYQTALLTKTKLSKSALQEFTLFVFSKIVVVPDFYISETSRKEAFKLCSDIDLKDIVYIALSIELGFPLLTRDKALYEGILAKGFKNIILFDIFIDTIFKQIIEDSK